MESHHNRLIDTTDFISRQTAIDSWRTLNDEGNNFILKFDRVLATLPPLDRPVAQWVKPPELYDNVSKRGSAIRYECSNCSARAMLDWDSRSVMFTQYCPRCGAWMDI